MIRRGFPEHLRVQAATLYFKAFSGKLGRILGTNGRGVDFLGRIFDPDFCFCAVSEDQEHLLGIAGFKTAEGSLTGGRFSDLASVYGWLGALWRAPLLALLERDCDADQLLMDGIAVARAARGHGIGTALLCAVAEEAAQRNLATVRLDVIDTNPRARALYTRFGFAPIATENTGPLRHLFGFSASTNMQLDVVEWMQMNRRAMTARPRLLLTGFSVFPGAPVNPTELLVNELLKSPGQFAGRCEFRAEILDVDYATIGVQLQAIAAEFEPDIALHFGLADDATGFRLERYGRNSADSSRRDNKGGKSSGIVVEGGPDRFESTLPRTQIAAALDNAGLPVSLDDQAGDYLCNALFYLSRAGACGGFKPPMSGFIHVPQLPQADGGVAGEGARLPLADLVYGARTAIDVCVQDWKSKWVAG